MARIGKTSHDLVRIGKIWQELVSLIKPKALSSPRVTPTWSLRFEIWTLGFGAFSLETLGYYLDLKSIFTRLPLIPHVHLDELLTLFFL